MGLKANWLLLDTSCPRAVVALAIDGVLAKEAYLTEQHRHDVQVPLAVENILKESGIHFRDLAGIAVGAGPGSFIGIRIGMAYAKGLAVALGIPLIGLKTLLAFAAKADAKEGIIAIDARRGELYIQSYESVSPGILTAKGSPSIVSREQYQGSILEGLYGPSADGMYQVWAQLVRGNKVSDEVDSLLPCYVREPDAKPPVF